MNNYNTWTLGCCNSFKADLASTLHLTGECNSATVSFRPEASSPKADCQSSKSKLVFQTKTYKAI